MEHRWQDTGLQADLQAHPATPACPVTCVPVLIPMGNGCLSVYPPPPDPPAGLAASLGPLPLPLPQLQLRRHLVKAGGLHVPCHRARVVPHAAAQEPPQRRQRGHAAALGLERAEDGVCGRAMREGDDWVQACTGIGNAVRDAGTRLEGIADEQDGVQGCMLGRINDRDMQAASGSMP